MMNNNECGTRNMEGNGLGNAVNNGLGNRLGNTVGNGQENGAGAGEVVLSFRGLQEKLGKIPRTLKAAAAIVLIAILVIVAVRMNTVHSGYKHILDEACALVNDRSTELDEFADTLLPGFAEEQYYVIMDAIGSVGYVEGAIEGVEDGMMEAYLDLEDEFGSNAKVSWKIMEKEEMSSIQIRRAEKSYQEFAENYLQAALDKLDNSDRIESLANRFELSRSDVRDVLDSIEVLAENCEYMDIERGYQLVLELEVEGSRDSDSMEVEVTMIYADGEWMLDFSSLGGIDVLTEVGEELDSLLWWL